MRQNNLGRLIVSKILNLAMDHAAADIDLFDIRRNQVVGSGDVVKLFGNSGFGRIFFDHAFEHFERGQVGPVCIALVTILPQSSKQKDICLYRMGRIDRLDLETIDVVPTVGLEVTDIEILVEQFLIHGHQRR